MSESQHLVFLCFERLLNLLLGYSRPNLCFNLVDFGAVCLETRGEGQSSPTTNGRKEYAPVLEAIPEVSTVQNKRILARLNEVGCDLIPTQST